MIHVISVGRDGSKCAKVGGMSFPVWAVKRYVAEPRKSDGVFTWRYTERVVAGGSTSGNSPSAKFERAAKKLAGGMGIPYHDGIAHGDVAWVLFGVGAERVIACSIEGALAAWQRQIGSQDTPPVKILQKA